MLIYIALLNIQAFAEQTSRKAAFIKKKLHDKRSVANAYVVYQDKESVEKALQMNGQVFKGKHLRVDSAINPKASIVCCILMLWSLFVL